MRDEVVSGERVRAFMERLGRQLRRTTEVLLVGGTSAVYEGWRESTRDIDIGVAPDDEIYGVLPAIKEELGINVELATPAHFIPLPPGWKERCGFIQEIGSVTFRHFDFDSQALAKLERGFDRDVADATAMVKRGLVDSKRLLSHLEAIEADLIRFPSIDPASFRKTVEEFVADQGPD